MLFNSYQFLIFFPAVVLIYFLIPHRVRYIWVLISSYYFYMCWSAPYALLLAASTLVTYGGSIAVSRVRKRFSKDEAGRGKKWCISILAVTFSLNLAILIFFKYSDFVLEYLNQLMNRAGVVFSKPEFDILLPVGISFYIFQALGYSMDVYRGDVEAESNVLRYAAFVSFFPQLVAGPIERSSNLLRQFYEKHSFDLERVKRGLMLMIWGYIQKMVVADRLSVLVDQVFAGSSMFGSIELLTGAVFFAFQIYCDFAGYSNIAIGAAQVMGFRLMENFNCPYLARSVAEFWRRWHISLSTWFRDYLYFPLGGSRCSKKRHYANLLIVFLTSGLWHGASWTYILWGGLNGLYQVIGLWTKPAREWCKKTFHIKDQVFSYRVLQWIMTFLLIDLAWIFFRADTIGGAFSYIAAIAGRWNPWALFDGTLYTLGLERTEFWIAVASIVMLMAVDILHYRGMKIRETLFVQQAWFRWTAVIGALMILFVFGVYGPGFNAGQFIYFQF